LFQRRSCNGSVQHSVTRKTLAQAITSRAAIDRGTTLQNDRAAWQTRRSTALRARAPGAATGRAAPPSDSLKENGLSDPASDAPGPRVSSSQLRWTFWCSRFRITGWSRSVDHQWIFSACSGSHGSRRAVVSGALPAGSEASNAAHISSSALSLMLGSSCGRSSEAAFGPSEAKFFFLFESRNVIPPGENCARFTGLPLCASCTGVARRWSSDRYP